MKTKMLVLGLLMSVVLATASCTKVEVDAGEVGYVVSKPLLFGKGGFVRLVDGPYSKPLCWRKFVQTIDVKQFTIDEDFAILAKDDLEIRFAAHCIVSVDPEQVRKVVEKYYGNKWYDEFFKERFRSCIYDAVQVHDSRTAKEQRSAIAETVRIKMAAVCAGTPFLLHDVVVGFVQYPEVVRDAVEAKLAKQQDLEQADTRVAIATKEAEIMVEEAKGIAMSQEIVNKTLTTNYLRHEYVQALMECARQPNTTIIYVPIGDDGLPFVQDVSQ